MLFVGITERIDQLMLKDKMHPKDREREALFFIIAGSDELWRLQNQIYNFEEHSIETDILESGICTSSKKLIRIGFNLFNNYETDSVLNMLSGLDDYNFELVMRAIRIRLNKIPMDQETPKLKKDISDYLV